ncbi:Unconventional myosin-VIIb [Symbiodinium microadriaticum]|uniref:Unconventional myosin-VIIb n=1 Tax=Symbiodinium microadriaticum TaxID=2951 RepID=A0A1Q9E5X8_SYMMI|nr:Unconventional myosin-VIIb [Symbiodinium microadriaticum]
MAKFWVPHAERVWTPCRVESDDGQTLSLISEDGEAIDWPVKEADCLEPVQDCQLDGVEDVCTLPAVSEAALLHTLRVRYFRQEIYTRVARILISVNPFHPLPIYGKEWLLRHQQPRDSRELPPHIYGIGHDALQGLSSGYKDQAIVISGESGAGKTESAKFLLNFIAESVKGHSAEVGAAGLEAEVVRTNPILEAFGNASTTRNANSSRFGKWLDLRFSEALAMRGCRITSYLLEVTRVCGQAPGERGFHVFYQLLEARSDPALQLLALRGAESYRYLQHSPRTSAGDSADFCELCNAFLALGFDTAQQFEVFQLLAGILELGNCEINGGSEDEEDPGLRNRPPQPSALNSEPQAP